MTRARRTYLSQVDRQIDLVVFHAPGQRRTLPPRFLAVDRVFGRMAFVRPARVAMVAHL